MANNEAAKGMSALRIGKIMGSHPRLFVSVGLSFLVVAVGFLFGFGSNLYMAIVGYDVGAIVYILWAFRVMYSSTPTQIRQRAISQDDGKIIVLMLVLLAILFSTIAIFAELSAARNLQGSEKHQILFLALLTITTSWFFTNIVFSLHYAHDYYYDLQKGRSGGLVFLPIDEEPAYLDFLYFAFILGATAQTADVTLSSKKMRRTCTLHSILAFFFNTSLLALTINLASGLF